MQERRTGRAREASPRGRGDCRKIKTTLCKVGKGAKMMVAFAAASVEK